MRSLAEGKEAGFEKYAQIFKDNFVFLNIYCRSVQEEHDPRGPEGPYQFKDRSVPVLVIKRWDGETFVQQLGYTANGGTSYLKGFVDRAIAKNGPVVSPKSFLPLIKNYRRGEAAMAKKKPAAAYKSFQKVITAGQNKKKHPIEPFVVKDAQEQIEKILADGKEQVAEAEAQESASKKKSALKRVKRSFRGVPEIEALVEEAIAKLG